jgi:hypothetical protein
MLTESDRAAINSLQRKTSRPSRILNLSRKLRFLGETDSKRLCVCVCGNEERGGSFRVAPNRTKMHTLWSAADFPRPMALRENDTRFNSSGARTYVSLSYPRRDTQKYIYACTKNPAAAYQSQALSFRRVKVVFILLQPVDRPALFSTVLIERPKNGLIKERHRSLFIAALAQKRVKKFSHALQEIEQVAVRIKAFSLSAREI